MKKRQKTAAALTAALLAAVVLNVSNKSITVTEITVESEKIPPEFDGFTIMQISDLHNAEFGAGQSDITEIINSEKPFPETEFFHNHIGNQVWMVQIGASVFAALIRQAFAYFLIYKRAHTEGDISAGKFFCEFAGE